MLVNLVLAGVLLAANAEFLPYGQIPMGRPPGAPGPHHPSAENKTILQFISEDPQFSRLSKALNFSKAIASGLNDTSSSVTFFAVPDYALPGRRKKKTSIMSVEHNIEDWSQYDLGDVISLIEEFPVYTLDKDKDKKKRYRKFLKAILKAILSYHVVPSSMSVGALAQNSTLPTNLTIPSIAGGHAQRLGVQHRLLPPSVTINLHARIMTPNINATNGFVHIINHPLLPPAPVFKELFLGMEWFSTLTSALQYSGLGDSTDLKWVPSKDGKGGKLEGAKDAVTIFAPSNLAFSRLPRNLQFLLFSPLGSRALTKLLQAHIVPDVTFFTDYLFNATSNLAYDSSWVTDEMYDQVMVEELNEAPPPGIPRRRRPELIYAGNLTLPTLLTNFTLDAKIAKFNATLPIPVPPGRGVPHKIVTKVWVAGVPVIQPDLIGMNGAVHALGQLINPWKKEKHETRGCEDEWEDWESWMTGI